MRVTCGDCQRVFDDAERSCVCPHERLWPPEIQAQRDRALSLLGRDLRWHHDMGPRTEIVRVSGVAWNGLVTLHGYSGEFPPHLFTPVADSQEA